MRKIIAGLFITLDGVVEAPGSGTLRSLINAVGPVNKQFVTYWLED
jgi:hypothetical protein